MASTTLLAIPGQLLGPASKYKPGAGVHLYESNLYSSLLGDIKITQPASQSSKSSASALGPTKRISRITQNLPSRTTSATPAELPTISVSRGTAGASQKQCEVLPQVGNTVLCRVTRITPRQAVVAILVCGDTVLGAEWQGVIRVQDVRATEKDRVKVYESFRPGDIVRASVISLGDQANYYLSTASNELGVIMAVSEAGNAMYPVSWKEYKDPETGLGESRKVAKPF
ncbi:exosome component 1 [Diaporthe helianthi]|uniref:Exosome component 1 n=1 Tax=Diaporthe helianthi TaxID=158607 RepID=A0A2P5HR33_DIAHE|nr:exosome component 1 [Diaporthe helianthi]